MKLQQLRYVVKVAECGSITEASRRLFVSQPSITASIRDLENEMGVHIFERTNKGVIVSEEGETFLGYARQVLDQADLLEDKYKGASEQVPHFSVSCQHYSFAVNAFVDVIREFDAARYDFTLREEQTHEIIEDVAHMKSELGILYLSEHNREVIERMLAANELVFEGLFCAAPHIFVCADHPLAGRDPFPPEALEKYPLILLDEGDDYEIQAVFDHYGVHPRIQYTVQQDQTILAMVSGGLGISIMEELMLYKCAYPLASSTLPRRFHRDIGICVKDKNALSHSTQVFIDHARRWVLENFPEGWNDPKPHER